VSTRKANKISRILYLVSGIMVIITGIVFITGGAGILFFNRSADGEGYHWSNTYEVRTSTYAFTMEIRSLSMVDLYSRFGTKLFGADNAVQAKWTVQPVDTVNDLFTGLSTAANGKKYISNMETEGTVWNMGGPFDPEIVITSLLVSGKGLGGPGQSPFSETIWLAACLGRGEAKIEYQPVWDTGSDDKYLIIMNNDRTAKVNADIKMGFSFPVFSWLPWRLIPLGVIVCLGGIYVLWRGFKRQELRDKIHDLRDKS